MTTENTLRLVSSIVNNTNTQDLLTAYGLRAHHVTWEDTGRNKGSCWGPNISDMTLVVKSGVGVGTLMPVIRKPNFSDVSEDVPMDAFTVRVGNEKLNAPTKVLTLREYLSNLNQYTDQTRSLNLTCSRDDVVLTSSQCCVLPVDQGMTEFCVQLFNYQSYEASPAVLVVLVSKDGVSTQIVERSNQKIFFNDKGDARWFRVERLQDYRERVTGEKQEKVSSFTEMKEGEKRENVLMMFQVPLKVKTRTTRGGSFSNLESACAFGGAQGAVRGRCLKKSMSVREESRGMDMGMLSLGSKDGKFVGTRDLVLERDDRFPIRCTFQYYRTTDQDQVSEHDVKDIVAQLSQSSKVSVASGSLVLSTGDRKTEPDLAHPVPSDSWTGKLSERVYLDHKEHKDCVMNNLEQQVAQPNLANFL